MNKLFTILFFVLILQLSTCIKLGLTTKQTPAPAPTSCKRTSPCAKYPDLFIDELGNCYITLIQKNISNYPLPQYGSTWSSSDSSLTTTWTKVRIDPATLIVDTSDFKYSTSVGQISHNPKNKKSMPYGAAAGCTDGVADGHAIVDLTGTKWDVNDTFRVGGFKSLGSLDKSVPQIYQIYGGGYCGWNAPYNMSINEDLVHLGGKYLQMKYIG